MSITIHRVEDTLPLSPHVKRRQAAVNGWVRRDARLRHTALLERANAFNVHVATHGPVLVPGPMTMQVRLASVIREQLYLHYALVNEEGVQFGPPLTLHISQVEGELAELYAGLDQALAETAGVITQGEARHG